MSTRAANASLPGANHRLLHHRRISSRTRLASISKRQDALRTDGRSDLLVVHERGRAAELAVLSDARRIEHHHGAARLALDAATLRLPAAFLLGQLAQRLHQIELDDLPLLAIDLVRRLGSAERAHELLRGRIPLRLRTAGGALVLSSSAGMNSECRIRMQTAARQCFAFCI